MLNTLLASRATRQRSVTAQATSLVVHAALITAAVLATHQVTKAEPPETPYYVRYVPPPITDLLIPSIPRGDVLVHWTMPSFPVVIPDPLPPVDKGPIIDPREMFNDGPPNFVPGRAAPDSVGALVEASVDVPARLVPGSANVSYPEQLRAIGLRGDVQTTFVIDTTGRADMRTFRIVASTHARFSESATRAVASAKFAPAQVAGQKVRQWVLMPFVFSIK